MRNYCDLSDLFAYNNIFTFYFLSSLFVKVQKLFKRVKYVNQSLVLNLFFFVFAIKVISYIHVTEYYFVGLLMRDCVPSKCIEKKHLLYCNL